MQQKGLDYQQDKVVKTIGTQLHIVSLSNEKTKIRLLINLHPRYARFLDMQKLSDFCFRQTWPARASKRRHNQLATLNARVDL